MSVADDGTGGMLARVVARLDERGVAHRVIGATALAAHGVARSTRDVDLLVRDTRVLQPEFWAGVAGPGERLEVRTGDPTDPLIGVVRLVEEIPDDADWSFVGNAVDVVLPSGRWSLDMPDSDGPETVAGGLRLRVVNAVDLALLKIYAGGPRDGWDLDALLAVHSDRGALVAAIEARLPELPKRCAKFWRRVVDG